MSGEAKHTPGPWAFGRIMKGKYRGDFGVFPIYSDHAPSGPTFAYLAQGRDDIQEANARLIAAAPDTTAACGRASEILFHMAVNGGPLPSREELEEIYRLTAEAWNRATFAKAEGRS